LTQRVKFQTLRSCGPNDRLVRWTPVNPPAKWKGYPRSIELRLLTYKIPGFRAQTIVTNQLDVDRLTYEDWTRLSWQCDGEERLLPGLYSRRWEIETTFRELKVTQGMEEGLRSRTPASLQFEVAGHIVLYLLVRWLMTEAAVQHGIEPLRLSF